MHKGLGIKQAYFVQEFIFFEDPGRCLDVFGRFILPALESINGIKIYLCKSNFDNDTCINKVYPNISLEL